MEAREQQKTPPTDSSQEEVKVKRQKGVLRKLDDYLTPAPKFDPEDPA